MKRLLTFFLTAALLLGMLAGCGSSQTAENSAAAPKPSVPEKPEASQTQREESASSAPSESSQTTDQTESPPTETEDPLAFQDASELRALLAGEWTYRSPNTGDDQVWITFSEDGSYFLENETSGGDFRYTYSGSYQIDSWTGETVDPPDMLNFSLSETTDEDFSAGPDFPMGDYIISRKTICDGEVMIQLGQANNGDSFFSLKFEDYSPVLRKSVGWQPQGEVRENAEFVASVWKVDHETRTVWLDDTALDGIWVNDGRHESLPYAAAEQVDLFGVYPFDENALAPGETCSVITDKEGVVQILEPFYSRKAMLSEEEAFSILAEYEEIQLHLAQGMTMLWDGSTEEIEGANCLLIAVGTDHNEHFVQEYLYAVSDLGIAYWYDADGDAWLPLAFG